jgi:predicted nucleotide-binding protein
MVADADKVPVEYVITTTSDWTAFEIEGGWWEEIQFTFMQGADLITQKTFEKTKFFLLKPQNNNDLVVVNIKCMLNIAIDPNTTILKYKVTKGCNKSTDVDILFKGDKIDSFKNDTDTTDPKNPLTFSSPISAYGILRKQVIKKKRKVFIIHGRDEKQALKLQKYLDTINVKAIIFDDLADKGKTIIEQIEYIRKNIDYAIAILTPDDMGCLADDQKRIKEMVKDLNNIPKEILANSLDKLQPRARQNVIFEIGLFMGALGRENVCCLKQIGIEDIPSDIDGLLFKNFEKDAKEVYLELPFEIPKTKKNRFTI